MRISVKGGTNAGWRIVRHMRRKDWRCGGCGARNKYFWTTCANCNARRPENSA